MYLPLKRRNSLINNLGKSRKKFKSQLDAKVLNSKAKPKYLSKIMWIEILDYLDTRSYFLIIPRINSFFYILVKNSKNYRTSLKYTLKVDFAETSGYKISKFSKGMNIFLNCENLNKLNIRLIKTNITRKEECEINLNFSKFFIPMVSLNRLKVLKIIFNEKFSFKVGDLLALIGNLHTFKVVFQGFLNRDYFFFYDDFIKNYGKIHKKSHLKNLSFKYYDIDFKDNIKIDKIIESLDNKTDLEKFSMKSFPSFSENIELPKFLKSNYNLKCLELPSNFFFNEISAKELCIYIGNSQILEELNISDTVLIILKDFIEALNYNRSLKILNLKHYLEKYRNGSYQINIEDSCELFNALAYTLIEDFSMITFLINKSGFSKNPQEYHQSSEAINELGRIYCDSLDNFLLKSEKIWKINVYVHEIPYKSISSIADLIIKHARLGKIHYFAGFNIKLIIENRLEILEIKKKLNKWLEIYGDKFILYKILSVLLIQNDSILKLTDEKSFKINTDVKKFLKKVDKSKKLVINPKKSCEYFSQLHIFSLIVLSTKITGITELCICEIRIESYNFVFPKLLKKFKSLEKLNIKIENNYKIKNNIKSTFKAIKTLKSITNINFTLESSTNIKITNVFSDLASSQSLKKFKMLYLMKNFQNPENDKTLSDFIALSRLTSLVLFYMRFTLQQFSQLATGLENSQTLTCLRLEKLFLEVDSSLWNNEELLFTKKNETILVFLSTLENKKFYEKISLYFMFLADMDKNCPSDVAEKYIASVFKILKNNKNLIEFNAYINLKDRFLSRYSEIVLDAIRKNKSLKIVNKFDIGKFKSGGNKANDVA